jgi:hypothetical protein
MKRNIAQLAVEQEATPGTAETIAAADVLVRLREGYGITPDHELFDLEEISAVSSKTAAVLGRKSLTVNCTYILRGPGDTTTDPTIVDMWESAMLEGYEHYSNTIGAVTGGPFTPGETVNDGGGNDGIVTRTVSNGDASIYYITTAGTQFGNTASLTGETSGATATTSSTSSAAGYAFRPADWASGTGHHATIEGLVDGYYWQGRGCLSDIQWEFSNGGPCIVTQNLMGALSAQGNKSLYTVDAYPEASVTPPKFLNAGLYIDTYNPTGVIDMTINYPTNPTLIEDANDSAADGVLYADYSRDMPTVTLEVDQALTTDYDYFATLQAGSTIRFEFVLGSTSGSTWRWASQNAQIRSIGTGSREPNRATFQLELGLTGDNNNELIISQY